MSGLETQKQILAFKTDILKMQHEHDISNLVNEIKKLRAEQKIINAIPDSAIRRDK